MSLPIQLIQTSADSSPLISSKRSDGLHHRHTYRSLRIQSETHPFKRSRRFMEMEILRSPIMALYSRFVGRAGVHQSNCICTLGYLVLSPRTTPRLALCSCLGTTLFHPIDYFCTIHRPICPCPTSLSHPRPQSTRTPIIRIRNRHPPRLIRKSNQSRAYTTPSTKLP